MSGIRHYLKKEEVEAEKEKKKEKSKNSSLTGSLTGKAEEALKEREIQMFSQLAILRRCKILKGFGIMWLAPFCHRNPRFVALT